MDIEKERSRDPRPAGPGSYAKNQLYKNPENFRVSFHRGSSRTPRRWRVMAWSLAAGVIDVLMMFSLTCLMVGVFVFVMGWKLSLAQVLKTDALSFSMLLTLGGFYACYLLVFRVFLGCTLGEWACGLRLGEPRHRLSPTYSMRVHYRFLITLVTGVVTLPILSLVFGVDLAGKLSGLPLVSQGFSAK